MPHFIFACAGEEDQTNSICLNVGFEQLNYSMNHVTAQALGVCFQSNLMTLIRVKSTMFERLT